MERRVVITGLGAVSPLGSSAKATWQAMQQGQCGIGHITKFDTTDYKVTVAAEVKEFDPLSCMEKGEVRRTDLNCQYALAAAKEAMIDSGLAESGESVKAQMKEGSIAPERLGVYIGSGIGGIHTTCAEMEKLMKSGPKRISPYMVTMMISNMATGLVAIEYNAQGPSLPIVTACATSTHAVGEAFRAIHHGYADAIIAGGTEAAIVPLAVAGFTNCMALTKNPDPKMACVPFDARRDGFVMGAGAAILVLEEYEHAKARGAHIYCEVVGYGNTDDAHHVTAPDPEAGGITRAIRMAVEQSGLTVEEGLYINAHGTSTPLNDKSETLAFKKALGEEAARKASISSTKSMTGHMLGATGAMEACVCAYALHDGKIPPTIGLEQPDPDCDLDYTPGTQAKAFDGRWALSTNLGFGGHNACLAFKRYEEARINP